MQWLVIILTLMSFTALADDSISISLGDLDIPTTRMPTWRPATAAGAGYTAAQNWQQYDATCECETDPCSLEGGAGLAEDGVTACNAASGTLPFPASWGCVPADAQDDVGAPNEASEDWSQINCQLAAAPDESVIYLPDGTYDMGNGDSQALLIQRSNIVLRGESRTGTILQATSTEVAGAYNVLNDTKACGSSTCWGSVLSMGNAAYLGGTTTPWTAGYDTHETQVTVTSKTGLSDGLWVMLRMDCDAVTPEDSGNSNLLNHIAKVVGEPTGVGPYVVTIDRGLKMDYDSGSDGDRTGCPATATARPWVPEVNIGIENVSITSDPALSIDDLGVQTAKGLIGAGGVADSWVVDSNIGRTGKEVVRLAYTARMWWQGNKFYEVGSNESSFTHGFTTLNGAIDNVLENNWFTDFRVAVMLQQGTEGTILGYNYFDYGTPPHPTNYIGTYTDRADRTIFVHGRYSRALLFEGNSLNGPLMINDQWWGPNGEMITAYRNRLRGTVNTEGTQGGVATLDQYHSSAISPLANDKDGSPNYTTYTQNVIGNTAGYYYTMCYDPHINDDMPNGLANSGCSQGRDFDAVATSMWIEKNVFRDFQTCTGDTGANRCGLHIDSPEATTSCGEVGADCGADIGQNEGTLGPLTNIGDTIPHSLYRSSATAPDWWCQESCDWSDVYSGIGAWGDEFCVDVWDQGGPPQDSCSYVPDTGQSCADTLCDSDGASKWGLAAELCKLPAQILAEAGTCTPLASTPSDVGTGFTGVSRN